MMKSLANRLYMKQRLYFYKFMEDRAIDEQLREFNKSIDDLENIDVLLEDEDKVIILLNALPKSFDHLKDVMLFGRENAITFDEVQAALKAKQLQNRNFETHDEGLLIKNQKVNTGSETFANTKGRFLDGKETRKCYHCKRVGHLRKDCFILKRAQEMESGWIMSSGCSFHMCPHREWFSVITYEDHGSVQLGTGQVCRVEGIGCIRLKIHDGTSKLLSGVRYVPKLRRNLISLGMMESKGYTIESKEGHLYVLKGEGIALKGKRKCNLYHLDAETILGSSEIDVNMWLRRLGHTSKKSLDELIRRSAIQGMNADEIGVCETYKMGKSEEFPFLSEGHSSSAPLDYAHADLWGPSSEMSLGGARYFLSIVDNFSRKLWIYILKEKSEAYGKFKQWCQGVELEKKGRLKYLRTGNDLDFLSKEFQDFCTSKGIKRHRTVRRNPQQNDTVERMNRTVLDKVKCMLLDSGLPRKFWGEAVSTAAYLINKIPSSAINFKTPNEKWYGSIGEYSHLRVFGCRAYAHVKQGKQEYRAVRCIMLGYPDGAEGYRLWCTEPGENKLIISRDVIFEETNMPYLSEAAGNEESNNDKAKKSAVVNSMAFSD